MWPHVHEQGQCQVKCVRAHYYVQIPPEEVPLDGVTDKRAYVPGLFLPVFASAAPSRVQRFYPLEKNPDKSHYYCFFCFFNSKAS